MEDTQHMCRIRVHLFIYLFIFFRVHLEVMFETVEMDEIIREREQRDENDEGAEDGVLTFKG